MEPTKSPARQIHDRKMAIYHALIKYDLTTLPEWQTITDAFGHVTPGAILADTDSITLTLDSPQFSGLAEAQISVLEHTDDDGDCDNTVSQSSRSFVCHFKGRFDDNTPVIESITPDLTRLLSYP